MFSPRFEETSEETSAETSEEKTSCESRLWRAMGRAELGAQEIQAREMGARGAPRVALERKQMLSGSSLTESFGR